MLDEKKVGVKIVAVQEEERMGRREANIKDPKKRSLPASIVCPGLHSGPTAGGLVPFSENKYFAVVYHLRFFTIHN